MEKRYARLVELLGEEEAKVYRPIVDAAIEDYEAHFKAADDSKKATKQETKKAAIKRGKNDAGIDSSEREQARRGNGKTTKKETKKVTTKTTKK
jgi:hypothetical protein